MWFDKHSRLRHAVKKGRAPAIRRLIESGADVNAQSLLGDTPLVVAARNGDAAVVRILLDAGAEATTTALKACTSTQAVNAFAASGIAEACQKEALASAARGSVGTRDKLKMLLDGGLDVNARDADGNTALVEIAKFAAHVPSPGSLEADVAPGVADPMFRRMQDGIYSSVVHVLLQAGADVNAQCSMGYTALMWSARWGTVGIARELLAGGADVHARNKEGLKATDIALAAGNTDVVNALADRG